MTRVACHSDLGFRPNQEDAGAAFIMSTTTPVPRDGAAFLVFDGVGGNAGGQLASSIALREVASRLNGALTATSLTDQTSPLSAEFLKEALNDALGSANRAILARADQEPALRGMATTAVCTLIMDGMLVVAWAGDSRCYLCRVGGITRLTRDHSEAEELVEAGVLDPQEAECHPLAHTITKYVGQAAAFQPDVRVSEIETGDVVLLCTDGLTDVLSDEAISAQVAAGRAGAFPWEELPRHLTEAALQAGTMDNVTVVACEYQPANILLPQQFHRTVTEAYASECARVFHNLEEEHSNV